MAIIRHFDYLLIDDDALMRKLWSISAQMNKIYLSTIESFADFSKVENLCHIEETKIYVDYFLGSNGEFGTYVCEKLHKRGYHKLYLTTAAVKFDLKIPDYILGIVSKMPPWGHLELQGEYEHEQ